MSKFSIPITIYTKIELDAENAAEAEKVARDFVQHLEPTEPYIDGWNATANNWVSFFEDFEIHTGFPTPVEEDEDE
jgi:ABC-type lipoprotein release transport system permease subunit